MGLDKVLLSHKEQNDEYNFLHMFKKNPTNRNLADKICKAQCLKLLKVLEDEPCNHPCHCGQGTRFHCQGIRVGDCPKCMAELKKSLKEV